MTHTTSLVFVTALCLASWTSSARAQAPLTLDQAVSEALANNLDLKAQRMTAVVAEAREVTAALRPNPVLTVSGQTLNLLGLKYSPDTPFGPNQFTVHADVPIERGGKREERLAVAKAETSLTTLAIQERARQVIATVQEAYVDAQHAAAVVAVARDSLRSLEGVVAINEARLAAGDLAAVELDRSRVAALQYGTAVQQAQLQLDQAKARLALAMGRGVGAGTTFDVSPDLRRESLDTSLADLTTAALTRRPDYLADQQTEARSTADVRLQLANGRGDYTIGVELSRQQAWGFQGNSMGLYFSTPLKLFNRNQGEIARAQREREVNGARALATEASIRGEVEQAYRQHTVSGALLSSIETTLLARAQGVRDTMEYSYRRGEASLVEYLDAQRAFNEVMQSYHDARANYARSLYSIDTVTAATVRGR